MAVALTHLSIDLPSNVHILILGEWADVPNFEVGREHGWVRPLCHGLR